MQLSSKYKRFGSYVVNYAAANKQPPGNSGNLKEKKRGALTNNTPILLRPSFPPFSINFMLLIHYPL